MAENPFDPNNPAYQYNINASARWTPAAVPPPPVVPGWSSGGSVGGSFGQSIPQAPIFNLQPNWSSPLSAFGQVGNAGNLPPGFMINPALRAPAPVLQAMGAVNPGIPISNPFAASTANYAGSPVYGQPFFSGGGRPTVDPAFGRLLAPAQTAMQANPNTNAMEQELRRWMRDTVDTLHTISSTTKRELWLAENPVGVPPGGPRLAYGGSVPPVPPPPPPPSGPWGPIVPPPPGGRGGGGGGAGGGGYNNWMHGFQGIGSMLGIGRFTYGAINLGNAIGGFKGGLALGGAAAIGELIYKGANLPLEMGHLAAGSYAASQGYTDYMMELANASRATGGDFRGISQQWIPNWGVPSASWGNIGITPLRALQSLQRIGGMRPGMDTNDFIVQARNLRLSSAYGMLPEGSVEALGQQGLKYGINTAQNPLALAEQFAGTIETAFARGADRSEVFKQIQTATEVVARSSVYAPNTQGMADMMQRMFQVDMPGARSGVMQQQLIGGVNAALDNPFGNPMRAFLIDRIRRTTNWNDPNAVTQLFGPGVGNSQYGRDVLGALQGNSTSPAFLDKALAGLMQGNSPEFLSRIAQMPNPYGNSPTGRLMWTQTLAGALGVRPEVMGGYLESGRYPTTPGAVSPAPGSFPQEMYRSEAEAQTDLLRGMRQHFQVFGQNIDLLNTAFGNLINNANDAALALSHIARQGAPGVPGWLGSLWGGITHRPVFGINPISAAHAAEATTPEMQQYIGQTRENYSRIARSIVTNRYPSGSVSSTRAGAAPAGFSLPTDSSDFDAIRRTVAAAGGNAKTQAAFLAMFSPEDPGLNPSGTEEIRGSSGVGGIGGASWAQWTASRRRQLESFGWTGTNKEKDRIASEKMLYWELTNNKQFEAMVKQMNDAGSASESARIGGFVFEQGGSPAKMFGYRGGETQAFMDSFHSRNAENFYQQIIKSPLSVNTVRGAADRHDEGPSSTSIGVAHIDLHAAFEHLASITREVASHLHELGHSARNATSGVGSKHHVGVNTNIAKQPVQQAQAYP